ncbi:MAG: hypothetical protein S0880_22755 [Actinomycetota bacterium]|nr:hypothetical protein [Actinomycetota bacterium]
MKRLIASTAMASVLVGGAAAAVAAGVPTLAGAQSDDEVTTTTVEDTTSTTADAEDDVTSPPSWVDDVLEGLVADGTLTATQADAVADALEEARPARGGRFGPHGPFLAADAVAEVLGMEPDELGDALRDGQTLAELAEAAGVDAAAVVDAIVTAAGERIDDLVEDGRLTAEEAAEKEAEVAERAEAIVAGEYEGPFGRGFGPGRGGPRGGWFGRDG